MSRPLRIYSYCIGVTFWVVLTLAVAIRWHMVAPELRKVAPLLAIAVLGEELVIKQRQRSGSPVMSFSAVAHVAAIVIVGPMLAAAMAAIALVVADGLRPDGRRYLLLNSAMLGGSTWIAGVVYAVAGGQSKELGLASLPALSALILTRSCATATVLAGGTALATSTPFIVLLRESIWEETGSGIGEGSLGVLVAVAFSDHKWIIVPFLAPLLVALYRSQATFQQLRQETSDALDAIVHVVDERDPSTARHSERVTTYVADFAEALGLPERISERLVAAARYHDLGKVAVDVATLASAERLSEQELQAIRRHPRLSAHLLSPFHFAHEMALYVELHHERYDGRGYYSVAGSDIPVEAHVLVVADSFDAMTSDRPYRPGLSVHEAVEEVLDKAGSQFHPLVARAFVATVVGDKLEHALRPEELRALRESFSRRHRLLHGKPPGFLDLRLITIVLAAASFALLAVPQVPLLIEASCGFATFVAAIAWLVPTLLARSALARGREILATAGSPVAALAAASMPGWVALLNLDDETGTYSASVLPGSTASDEELVEASNWALRREGRVETTLSGGRVLILMPSDRQRRRIAFGFPRRPAAGKAELVNDAAEWVQSELSQPSDVVDLTQQRDRRPAGGQPIRASITVELDLFESIRSGAGQLVADRAIREAEERMRALLRDDDAVERVGDDRFRVSLNVPDETSLDVVISRIAATVEQVKLPRRIARPKVRIARTVEAVEPGDALRLVAADVTRYGSASG
jgi:GGDEF domain-containing protein